MMHKNKDLSIGKRINDLENILINKYGYRKGKDGFLKDIESEDDILSMYSYFTKDNVLITLNTNLLPREVACTDSSYWKYNISDEEKNILNELLNLKYSDWDLEIE